MEMIVAVDFVLGVGIEFLREADKQEIIPKKVKEVTTLCRKK